MIHPLQPADSRAPGSEDLSYRVELWDAAEARVEQVVAATATASLAYAVFYAAAREYPQRRLTLRGADSVLAVWTARP